MYNNAGQKLHRKITPGMDIIILISFFVVGHQGGMNWDEVVNYFFPLLHNDSRLSKIKSF